ncbi:MULTISPECIES: ATP-grasp domain-containing protein [unclassified Sutcliffiella]|uniref:ATP-grasp domain-containing protein n=1 Tax=unclassified Sutcliffiella TaxID=2837532 RepID=UPI0030D17004
MDKKINILFTSSGRRVSLINSFIELREDVGKIITADRNNLVPTAMISDKHYTISSVRNENYISEIINICKEENINLVVPLIDPELTILSKSLNCFEEIGVKVLVSSEELNNIANNKVDTYNFFIENNILTPKVYNVQEINEITYPIVIKPFDGSSSKGVTIVKNVRELSFFREYIPNAMIQEYVVGKEYTVDVMLDFSGNIITIVPRLRIETRAGEVSKGRTVKDIEIINAAKEVVEKLPGAMGCITLQCFKKDDGSIVFIEINPRFGGGIPLSIGAGANFALWTIQILRGNSIKYSSSWKEDVTMLRYDKAILIGT